MFAASPVPGQHAGPMQFLGRPNHHDVKGYVICVVYVDSVCYGCFNYTTVSSFSYTIQ